MQRDIEPRNDQSNISIKFILTLMKSEFKDLKKNPLYLHFYDTNLV